MDLHEHFNRKAGRIGPSIIAEMAGMVGPDGISFTSGEPSPDLIPIAGLDAAFDPRRCTILLLDGDKTGNPRGDDERVPVADRLYDEHWATLKQESLLEG